jgi:hypothetical protein
VHCLESWTLGGEVLLVGDPPAHVKLAAFYTCCHDFYYASHPVRKCAPAALVSNVAALGPAGGEFALRVDVSSLRPCPGHYVYLILWADGNGNDAYDAGEDWKYVIPLYDDCLFREATDCVYYYVEGSNPAIGAEPGWNQSIGLDLYAPVICSSMEGARLSNESAWCRDARETAGVLTRVSGMA